MPDVDPAGQASRQTSVARGHGREALCRALPRVVAREGFDGVTFRSVAAEAGVTHGLASYHFKNREAMIHEALRWAVEHTIETTHLAAPVAEIHDFARDVPAALSESPEDAVFQFELLLRALRSPALLNDIRRSYDDYVTAIAKSLKSFGIEGDAIARLVFAALDGVALQQLLYGDSSLTEETIAELRNLLSLRARSANESATPTAGRPVEPDDQTFRDTMASVCCPVTVITGLDGQRAHGTTVSAFSSLSLAPPLVMVALDRGSDILALIERTRTFGINLLVHGHEELALRFAKKGADKFEGVDWIESHGLPRISCDCGWLACDIADILPGGDHVIVIGVVHHAEPIDGAPLAYQNRRFGTHSEFAAVERGMA